MSNSDFKLQPQWGLVHQAAPAKGESKGDFKLQPQWGLVHQAAPAKGESKGDVKLQSHVGQGQPDSLPWGVEFVECSTDRAPRRQHPAPATLALVPYHTSRDSEGLLHGTASFAWASAVREAVVPGSVSPVLSMTYEHGVVCGEMVDKRDPRKQVHCWVLRGGCRVDTHGEFVLMQLLRQDFGLAQPIAHLVRQYSLLRHQRPLD